MIFKRLLVSELASSAGAVFTVLFSVVVTIGLVTILGQAAGGSIDSRSVFELMAYSSFTNLPALLALSMFIAVLMVMMRSWQDSEIPVWFSAGGLSLLRWIAPVLRFSLPMVVLVAVISIAVTPWAKDQIERTAQQFEQRSDVNRIAPGRFIETMGGRRIFFIEEVSADGSHVKNVFVSERSGESEIIVRAESGEVRATPKGERYVVLKNGRRYDTSRRGDAAWRVTEFDTYELRIGTRAEQAYINRDVETMSFASLMDLNTPQARAEMVWRLCWPLAALNLVLLAIPLSYTNPRAGRSMSLIIAVLIFILYLNGISVMESWVKIDKLNWIAALVILNGAVALFTTLLFVRRVWLQRWIPQRLAELPYKLLGRGE